jgi:hypothetical protein
MLFSVPYSSSFILTDMADIADIAGMADAAGMPTQAAVAAVAAQTKPAYKPTGKKRPLEEPTFTEPPTRKQKAPKEKSASGKQAAKDSTAVSKMTEAQFEHLRGRLCRGLRIVKPSPAAPESTWCHVSTLTRDQGGYPKNLVLNDKLLKGADPAVAARGLKGWCAGAVVLAASGEHAKHATDEASHLCNHPWCVRRSHLLWETPTANYSRKNCKTHHICSNCSHVDNPCVHTPQCLDMHGCPCDWHK